MSVCHLQAGEYAGLSSWLWTTTLMTLVTLMSSWMEGVQAWMISTPSSASVWRSSRAPHM